MVVGCRRVAWYDVDARDVDDLDVIGAYDVQAFRLGTCNIIVNSSLWEYSRAAAQAFLEDLDSFRFASSL